MFSRGHSAFCIAWMRWMRTYIIYLSFLFMLSLSYFLMWMLHGWNVSRECIIHTTRVEKVYTTNISGTHLSGLANADALIGNRNDCWLPVPREGISIAQQNNMRTEQCINAQQLAKHMYSGTSNILKCGTFFINMLENVQLTSTVWRTLSEDIFQIE